MQEANTCARFSIRRKWSSASDALMEESITSMQWYKKHKCLEEFDSSFLSGSTYQLQTKLFPVVNNFACSSLQVALFDGKKECSQFSLQAFGSTNDFKNSVCKEMRVASEQISHFPFEKGWVYSSRSWGCLQYPRMQHSFIHRAFVRVFLCLHVW